MTKRKNNIRLLILVIFLTLSVLSAIFFNLVGNLLASLAFSCLTLGIIIGMTSMFGYSCKNKTLGIGIFAVLAPFSTIGIFWYFCDAVFM